MLSLQPSERFYPKSVIIMTDLGLLVLCYKDIQNCQQFKKKTNLCKRLTSIAVFAKPLWDLDKNKMAGIAFLQFSPSPFQEICVIFIVLLRI